MLKTMKQRIPPFWRGIIVYIFTFAAVGMYSPFINLALDARGLTESQIGLFNAIPGAITIFSGPIISRMADKRRQRLLFSTIGFIMYGIFTALMGIQWGFWWLLGLHIISACITPPAMTLREAIAARMTTKHGLSFGQWRMWGSFGFAVASLSLGFLWQSIGIEWLFFITAVVFFLSAWIVNLLEEPEADQEELLGSTQKSSWHEWLPRDVIVWLFLIAVMLAHMAMQPFYHFSAIHMIRLGGTETMAGVMRAASAFVEVLTMWWASKLIKKYGAVKVFMAGAAIFATSWLGFSLATQGWMLIAITAFRGIGFGLQAVAAVVYLDSKAKASEAAGYQSLMNSLAMGIGPMIAGPLGGLLAERVGLSRLFGVASIVGWTSVGVCLLILFVQKRQTVRNR